MRSTGHSQAGFSLIELMVAVVVMGVVTAQLFIVMGNQKKVYSSNERAVDTQETARMTLDLISFDTRMGGYMVPTWTAVSSVDGGTDKPDRFCVSSMFADPGITGDPNNKMATVRERYQGAHVNAVGIAGSSVNVDTLNLNPLVDNVNDFATGSGIIVASKTETYCARIKQITPDPVPGGTNNTITFYSSDATTYLTTTAGGYLQAVPANVYELDKDTLELSRNGMLLASQIEDFQTEFWVDGSGVANNQDDGDAEFPVNDLEHPDPPGGGLVAQNDRIRRVRVTVLAVAPLEDQQNSATGHLSYGRPKIANRDAATVADRLRRRSFSASIMPRNVIGVIDPEI
jgi:prepilin-type N-terminal cleavage/methylation domain-containing protein